MKLITPNLETKRLILKKGSIEDYKLVYEFDFTKLRNINGEFEFVKQDLDKIVGFDTYADLNPYVLDWIIYLKEGTPIGNIVANRFNNELNSLELSFNLHPNYWGLGYMNEALIEVMNYIFSLGFENILCGYSEGNYKSKRIVEKLNFDFHLAKEKSWIKDGVYITDYVYILSKDKFNKIYK